MTLAIGKQPVELPFLRDQPVADADGFFLHLRKKCLHPRSLLRTERQLVGQFEHMQRARVAVELGRQRESHAASGPQIGDLLGRQRLDGARLQAGIRLMRLSKASGRCEADSDHGREQGFHGGLRPNAGAHSPSISTQYFLPDADIADASPYRVKLEISMLRRWPDEFAHCRITHAVCGQP